MLVRLEVVSSEMVIPLLELRISTDEEGMLQLRISKVQEEDYQVCE